MPMASSAASGASSDSRSGRTSQSAPPTPMTPAYLRPLIGWTFCARSAAQVSSRSAENVLRMLVALVHGVDIRGERLQAIERALHRRAHQAESVEQTLCFGVVALRF